MEQMLTTAAAAKFLDIDKPVTLVRWRYHRKGPPFVKIGRHIRYRLEDLTAFLMSSRIVPQEQPRRRGSAVGTRRGSR